MKEVTKKVPQRVGITGKLSEFLELVQDRSLDVPLSSDGDTWSITHDDTITIKHKGKIIPLDELTIHTHWIEDE